MPTIKFDTPQFPGVPVFMQGREYIVPSLSVKQFRAHYELITAPLNDGENVCDFIEKRVPVIGAALRRNYPEITDEQLLEMVDLGNFRQLVQAIQAASGMKPVKPGEAQPRPHSTGESTGAGSTAL